MTGAPPPNDPPERSPWARPTAGDPHGYPAPRDEWAPRAEWATRAEWASPVPPSPGPVPAAPQWGSRIGDADATLAPVWAGTAHRPGLIPLRPLDIGDLLQATWSAGRRAPGVYFGMTLVVCVVIGVVPVVIGSLMLVIADDAILTAIGDSAGPPLLSAVIAVVLSGIFAHTVAQQSVGGTPTFADTLAVARRHGLRLTGFALALEILMVVILLPAVVVIFWSTGEIRPDLIVVGLLMLFALAVPVVWLYIRSLFVAPAMVVEDMSVGPAIRRSLQLTTGRFWRTLGIVVLFNLIAGVIEGVLGMAATFPSFVVGTAVTQWLSMAATVIGTLVISPFLAVLPALLHVDARMRDEAFDVALARHSTSGYLR